MKITVLCVGKIKENYFTMAIDEYKKRLGRYCKIDMIEVADEKTPDHATRAEECMIKQKEGERLKKYLKDDAFICVLDIKGKQLDSLELSNKIERIGIDGGSHIIFVIGGSLGLNETILSKADLLLSFSKMTFPHQMMRVILLEQIYRGYRIMNNAPYHK